LSKTHIHSTKTLSDNIIKENSNMLLLRQGWRSSVIVRSVCHSFCLYV